MIWLEAVMYLTSRIIKYVLEENDEDHYSNTLKILALLSTPNLRIDCMNL